VITAIPRLIHYCWYGGGAPTPEGWFVDGWSDANPGWKLRLWDESNSPLKLPYVRNALEHGFWANASNAVRLWAVYRFGGVYLDTDVQLLRSLEPLRRYACFVGFQYEPGPTRKRRLDESVTNGVFGAVAEHQFPARALERLLRDFDGTEDAYLSSPRLTSELLLEAGLRGYRDDPQVVDGVTVLPKDRFYPYCWDEPAESAQLTPDTFAIHHWAMRW
jgi:mannosyltransferase OCH1-like enzyme